MNAHDIDTIDLEVFRSRLETIGEQACRAVEHTAISPNVTESKDYSVTLLDANGGLIVGSGEVIYHYGAAVHAVRSTLERHRGTLAPGDVFLSNDPHNGGGLHPQDVMVQQPIFHDGELVAFVAVSAHLIDMGGMAVGSFAPEASECYQEAFRVPPVRLFRAGEEATDIWDMLRVNVRMSELVEMDMRGLCAGAHFAAERITELVGRTGAEKFVASLTAIRDLTEAEFRRRIALIEDGTYRQTSWTEFRTQFYKIPCELTVEGDSLHFDFTGASPQTAHFFNSRAYIVAAELLVMVANVLARDLPFNDGIFAAVKITCEEGSILDSKPPAPIAAAHMHASLNAAGVGLEALMLALGASPEIEQHRYLGGASWDSAIGVGLWSWTDSEGVQDAFMAFDGLWVGGSGGAERDGNDLGRNTVGPNCEAMIPDIEVLESWYPLLFIERALRPGAQGAGARRAGAANRFSFRPHGVGALHGVTFGMRRWLPLQGIAGGSPGGCNEFVIHRGDGGEEMIDVSTSGAVVGEQDWLEMRMATGGGFGDPLDRDPALVERDVEQGRLGEEEARKVYGVILGDPETTGSTRQAMRRERLDRARPPAKPIAREDGAPGGERFPLYPGVEQVGAVAVASESGAPLARAPDHWTEGCALLSERRWGEDGPGVIYNSWLDPESGRVLHVEVTLEGEARGFEVSPRRWTGAK
jgi:N-methylhydantoinase B